MKRKHTAKNKQGDVIIREGQENSSVIHDKKKSHSNEYPRESEKDLQAGNQPEFIDHPASKNKEP